MNRDSYYEKLLAVKFYAELCLKCAIYNLKIPRLLTENNFDWYYIDDYRWDVLIDCIAGGYEVPF